MNILRLTSFAALATAMLAGGAQAVPTISVFSGTGGVTFSVDGSTITINETYTDATPLLLRFSGLDLGVDYTVIKNITNNSGATFTSFANELLDNANDGNDDLDPQPQPDFVPAGFSTSNDDDGLSFAQLGDIERTSNVYGQILVDEVTDRRDFLDFLGGSLANGASGFVQFGLTDLDGNGDFLLAQRPNTLTVVPEPAVWGLMIAGFGLVGVSLRRRGTARAVSA